MSDWDIEPETQKKREGIRRSMCGCFYCLATIPGEEIGRWCGNSAIAICPRCEIDSVLSAYEQDDIAPEALKRRKRASFGDR